MTNEIGRINYIPWNPIPNDHNDVNLGTVTDDNENEEVFIINLSNLRV